MELQGCLKRYSGPGCDVNVSRQMLQMLFVEYRQFRILKQIVMFGTECSLKQLGTFFSAS
jgi:hypothetical protein